MKTKLLQTSSLFLFAVLFVFGTACFSVYESNEALCATFFSGSVTQAVGISTFYYTTHFLTAEVYMKLYHFFPSVPWYAVVMFSYVAVALFVFLWLLFKNNSPAIASKLIFAVPVMLVLATEYILFLQYTRVAFALGTATVLLLIKLESAQKKFTFFQIALFVLCLLTRWEVGIFILLMQWLSAFLLAEHKVNKTVLLTNTFAVLLLIGYVVYDRQTSHDYVKQFQPELGYQLLDRGNIVPLSSMKTAVDSAKYKAVLDLISDPQYITIEFLRSLVRENAYAGVSETLITRCANILSDNLSKSKGVFIIYTVLLLLTLFQLFREQKKEAIKLLLFNLSVWLLLVLITYAIKMELRLFVSVLILLSFILLSKIDYSALSAQYIRAVLCVVMMAFGTLVLYGAQKEYKEDIKYQQDRNLKFTTEVKKKYAGKILMPDIRCKQMMVNCIQPFQQPDFSAFPRYYLFDCDVLYLEPDYNAYLRKECNCDAGSYTNFMDFLVSKKDSVRVISTEERISSITDYCQMVRGKNYPFKVVDSLFVDDRKLMVYSFQ